MLAKDSIISATKSGEHSEIPAPIKGERILELDSIRGLAALMVVVFHYTTYYDFKFGHTTVTFRFWEGATGVSLFFILSGYVIFMTMEKTKHWNDFVVSRFSRLYPAYWSAMIVTLLVVGSLHQEITWVKILANATMLQTWLLTPHLDWSYWSLYVELCFYFTMLGLFLLNLLKRIELMGFLLLLAMMIYNSFLFFYPDISVIGTAFPMLKWGNLFVAGILFYLVKKSGFNNKRIGLLVLCFVAEFFTRSHGNYIYLDVFKHLVIVAFYLFIFFALIKNWLKFLSNSFFLFFGSISYSLYLVHQNMGYVIIQQLYEYDIHPVLIIIIPMVIAICVATMITYFIEKPALSFIRKLYK